MKEIPDRVGWDRSHTHWHARQAVMAGVRENRLPQFTGMAARKSPNIAVVRHGRQEKNVVGLRHFTEGAETRSETVRLVSDATSGGPLAMMSEDFPAFSQ